MIKKFIVRFLWFHGTLIAAAALGMASGGERVALARAGIPILSVVGQADEIVPVEENTDVVEKRYRAPGGHIEVIQKPGVGQPPPSLKDPQPILDFILKAVAAGNWVVFPAGTDERRSRQSVLAAGGPLPLVLENERSIRPTTTSACFLDHLVRHFDRIRDDP